MRMNWQRWVRDHRCPRIYARYLEYLLIGIFEWFTNNRGLRKCGHGPTNFARIVNDSSFIGRNITFVQTVSVRRCSGLVGSVQGLETYNAIKAILQSKPVEYPRCMGFVCICKYLRSRKGSDQQGQYSESFSENMKKLFNQILPACATGVLVEAALTQDLASASCKAIVHAQNCWKNSAKRLNHTNQTPKEDKISGRWGNERRRYPWKSS